MQVLAGTSGFSFKEWKGSFYPTDLSSKDMLSFYAEHFSTVEINNTFYRLPKKDVLQGWASQVPAHFRFVIKASRRITHFARLKESSFDPLDFLLGNTEVLGDRLGPILFQTPPNLPKDLPRLAGFLAHLPAGRDFAFELRHPSWLDEEVYEALRAGDHALVCADVADEGAPLVPTASWGYLRLRKVEYADDEVREWAERVAEQPWERAYVFFKHEEAGAGPKLARRFLDLGGW